MKWTSEQFEAVDWDLLNDALDKKKNMNSRWLAKQASGFCGSRVMVSRMTPGSDDR
jgi:hypothetical protein